jgi:hypothetical protein
MEEIYKIIDLLDLTIGPDIIHSFDITKCSEEAQRFLEVFSEEEILCVSKYKNHKPLPYDDSLEDIKSKIFLGTYDDIDEYTIVSQQHHEELSKYKWTLYKYTNKFGTICKSATSIIGKYSFSMHIYIKGYIKGLVIDHLNGNSLDNSYLNLRNATRKQNAQNKPKQLNCSSQYIGVHYDKYLKKFKVVCSGIIIGYNIDEIEAGKMYDKFVLLHTNLGKQSKTNNLVTWGEVKDLKFDDIFPAKIEREMPKNISFDNKNTYLVRVQYNKITYSQTEKTLNDAIIAKEFLLNKVKKFKEDELKKHNNNLITRNLSGQAIIPIKNSNCIVDDEDWHRLSQFKWRLDKNDYAFNDKQGKMHRYLKKDIINEILELYEDSNLVIDHIDNSVNFNKKYNLRINTLSGNASNKLSRGTSEYKNVSITKYNTFTVQITKNSICYRGGCYETEIEALVAAVIINRKLYKTYAYKYDISYDDFIEHKDSVITNLKSKFNK